jgi:hypothetical protein
MESGGEMREAFSVPHMGNDGPQLLLLLWRAGEIHMVKDN